MPKKPLSIFSILQFIGVAAVVFVATFVVLYLVGAVPAEFQFFIETPVVSVAQPSSSTTNSISGNTDNNQPVVNGFFTNPNLPQRVIIPSINVNSVILNPQTTDVVVLDNDLLHGAVRYPTSSQLGQGTVFLFGHNTGLAALNPAYKTFNGLRTVKTGAQIEIDSATTRYFYTITALDLVNSNTAYVTLSATDNELIISTCNVFGAKEQRYIVHASFTNSAPLSS